ELLRFRLLVTAESPMGVVVQQAAQGLQYRTLLCYYADSFAKSVEALADEELAKRTLSHFNKLVSGSYDDTHVAFTAVRRWLAAGTVLSPAYAKAKQKTNCQATDRIFLAG